MSHFFDPLFEAALSERAKTHQLRRRKIVEPLGPVRVRVDGKTVVNFCSNNYLGLTHHPRVMAAMNKAALYSGAGAGAAGLISGYSPAIAAAEEAIAAWKGTEKAILLPSGYQANHAVVQTLAAMRMGPAKSGLDRRNSNIRFLVDKLAHASLLDAVRASGAPWRVFPHNGLRKLGRLLEEAPADQLQVVVTESIFSMDGDCLDPRLVSELKPRHKFLLLLDEAHGGGVYGKGGSGWANEQGLSESVDVTMTTFSKAAGVMGGAVCGSKKLCEAVLNFGRAYIFSTSIAPAIATGILTSVDVMQKEPERQERVRRYSALFREALMRMGIKIPPGDSPIVPVVVGEENLAMKLAEQLFNQGLLVQPVRPPTIPAGTSRLRITLSSEHAPGEIELLLRALNECQGAGVS